MSKTKQELFLTSVNYTEAGPFTKNELACRATDRLFTWSMYILRLGEESWCHVREIPELCEILEANLPLKLMDAGPAGGLVIAGYYNPQDTDRYRYVEAAPFDVGFASWHEAQQLCNEYAHNGFGGWRLPTEEELRELACSFYPQGNWTRTTETVRHWSGVRKGETAAAVVTQEDRNYYQPRIQYPMGGYSGGFYISKKGPWIGNAEMLPLTYGFSVRPVRDFHHKKCHGEMSMRREP